VKPFLHAIGIFYLQILKARGCIRGGQQFYQSLLFFAFLWLFLLWIGSSAMGQYIDFRHLAIEDGLSQNAVYALLQDRQGLMWFGTKDGLNRYDGDASEFSPNCPIATTLIISP